MKYVLTIFNFMILLSCSTKPQLKTTPIYEEGKILGETTEFFLPMTPSWRNFSSASRCFLKSNVQYLDHLKIKQNYNVELSKSTEIQAYFNYAKYQQGGADLEVQNDLELLYQTIERIMGNVRYYDFPKYKQYNLILVDGIERNSLTKKLLKFLDSSHMNQGVPVLVSYCYKSYELIEDLKKDGLDLDFPYAIGAESLIHYNDDFKKIPFFYYDLSSLFKENAKLKVFKNKNFNFDIQRFLKAKDLETLSY